MTALDTNNRNCSIEPLIDLTVSQKFKTGATTKEMIKQNRLPSKWKNDDMIAIYLRNELFFKTSRIERMNSQNTCKRDTLN
mmetsp:Transcript_20263/g.48262  ORF Transcript_20263/g.48262 Transcript_20263/m.48262 type:complete len:81 (+) Transcript_20263:195-437(+)